MKLLTRNRMLGVALAPFALLSACAGLSPEEQSEYRELQEELRRIEIEEIQPRQVELKRIIQGQIAIDVEQIQAQVNQIRNEKLAPLNDQLASLHARHDAFAAPGTRLELEELRARHAELESLFAGIESEVHKHRDERETRKITETRGLEELLDELEAKLAAAGDDAAAIEAEIAGAKQEIERRKQAIDDEFIVLIHGLEIALHDISEEQSEIVRKIHLIELSAPEELERTIEELDAAIHQIVTSELRPLIEQLAEAAAADGVDYTGRERLRLEIEQWLDRAAAIRARINELTSKSLDSIFEQVDLSELPAGVGG